MEQQKYLNEIEERLSFLAMRIELRAGLNILDLNILAENFYAELLNIIFDLQLVNENIGQQNADGIDLVDHANKIVAQVSSTVSKAKIESSLSKDLKKYAGYRFKFVSISKDANVLRKMTFANPHALEFCPSGEDIQDIKSLLRIILDSGLDKLRKTSEFLHQSIKMRDDPQRVESNLAKLIGTLCKINWNESNTKQQQSLTSIPYDIEAKIKHNKIEKVREIINDYKVHYHRIDKIYSEFDLQGVNKSISVLNGIRTVYSALNNTKSSDDAFLDVINKVIDKVNFEINLQAIPEEELEMCIQILVVDAFIRCKIFENPEEKTPC